MKFENSVIDVIKSRKSRRNYLDIELSQDIIVKIKNILSAYSIGPFGNIVKFYFVEKSTAIAENKVKLGTYGFISGPKYFIVSEIKKSPHAFEDSGYLFEKVILHLTELGLGTCWLGGTFSRKDYVGMLNIEKDSIIPAITPVGYANDKKNFKEKIVRWGAKADNRISRDKLFFNEDISTSLTKEEAGMYYTPLEMLRIAPSASNKQPWRVIKQNNVFHFCLRRTPGYNKTIKNIDLQLIDIGIAMAHFELSCETLELIGNWEILNSKFNNNQEIEYIISWCVQN